MEGTLGDMTKFLQSWLTLRNKCEETKGNEGRLFVNFVKEGEIGPRAGVEENGLLRTATDWKMWLWRRRADKRKTSNERSAKWFRAGT